jgi:type IV pilus assembly protein PilM
MASFFKKKNKTEEETPGAGMPVDGTRAGRNSRSEKPKKVKEPKPQKAPKPPRKPLFGKKKKKDEATAGPGEGIQANVPLEGFSKDNQVKPQGFPPAGGMAGGVPDMPGAPTDSGKPKRGSIFGRKKKGEGSIPAAKPPKQKRVKTPKQAKPPKQKKMKEPKAPRPPRGKRGRKGAPEPLPGTVAIPERMPPGGEPFPGALPSRKGRSGKKPKAPKPPKEARAARKPGEKKAAKRRIGPGKTSPVGLDIGHTSLTAVQLKYQVGGATLLAAAMDDLPEGLMLEGEVRDIDALAFAIKEFWKAHKIKGRKVELGLANQKVVVRTLEFPVLEESELRSAIEFQAQDYIPIPIEEAVFDFHVTERVIGEDGVEKLKVLVVAAQKAMVMDFVNAVKKAKLTVEGIDLQAFAMLRSLAPKASLELGGGAEAVAVANIASDVTNVVVSIQGEPQFTRIISFGGDNFTRAISEFEGISFAEAEELKAEAGLPAPGERREEAITAPEAEAPTTIIPPRKPEPGQPEPSFEITMPQPPEAEPSVEPGEGPPAQGPPFDVREQQGAGPGSGKEGEPQPPRIEGIPFERAGGPEQPQVPGNGQEPIDEGMQSPEDEMREVQRIIELTADGLADELRRSLDYYMAQEISTPITRLILSGGGAMIRNLDRYLSQVFPFPVELGDPLNRVTQNRSNLPDEDLRAIGPRLAIAVGLALEDEE